MYFNTFETAISIQIAPTIKIKKKITVLFFFLAAIHMPGSHDGSVSIVLSAGHLLLTKFVDLSRYEQSYRRTPLTL